MSPSDPITDTVEETWLPLPGYEGTYEVSDLGRIKSLSRTVAVRGNGTRTTETHILNPSANEKGYFSFMASVAGQKQKRVKVHLAVITAFIGPRPPGLVARHLNGNQADNRATNLAWGTSAENWADAKKHGTTWQQQVTHCKQKHELVAPNLTGLFDKKGFRVCLACARARNRIDYYGWPLNRLQAVADECYEQIMRGDPHLSTETHCKRRHEFTTTNTQLDRHGRRTCRACAVTRTRIPRIETVEDETRFQTLADQVFAAGGVLPPLPAKTRCKRGHRLAGPNLMPSALARGKRSCLACNRGNVLYRSRVRRGAICADPGLLEEVIEAKYREIVSAGADTSPRRGTNT